MTDFITFLDNIFSPCGEEDTTSCLLVKYQSVIYKLVMNRNRRKKNDRKQKCDVSTGTEAAQVRMSWACCSTSMAMFFTSPHQKSNRSFIPLI